ncbi:conserved hypothetical protein [Pseudarthrobacter chlorophenolicus A6]|uniref:Lipoprotein n=1 Tax=Pseudarthrobacter chlorophenolicus (strain ATCC 700700 / DSM 12829 / CIP 107037 / JCM 12360 / KCTC 9906 / NCIMB 13794 / A6) TaxID=452863 RepID=B8H7B9_PSECP|nr:hypothetical protein [Pseudarthrobacter chlorophenolicus]ACL41721.1 conserved hypothetical protein [Pseudarthrobacter chlorophenolicus A6]SDQ59507.1 hypothetical protein SAMN04489738_1705 [Pseudarthrobacter chlorophenolicus]
MTTTRKAAAGTQRRAAGVVLLLPALAAGLALGGCQLSAPDSATPSSATSPSAGSTVKTSEFSTLDAAGVETIRSTGAARLDMSSGTLVKESVQVTQDSYGPEINTRGAGKINLTIVAPSGEITGETDRIRFNTTDKRPDFSEVTYFLTASSAEEYFALIREGVQRYGIDEASAERWISSTESDPEGKSDFSITSGTATGLDVNYDLRYDGGKDTQVIIVHVRPAA